MVELKFAFYGRICAIVYVLAAVIVSAWQLVTYFNTSVPLGSYTIVAGLFVGLIELPVCCTCFAFCKILARGLRVVTGYWAVRGVLYAGISAAGYVIFKLHPPEKNGALLTVQILASLTAVLYFVAVAKCEPNPAVTGDDTGTGKAVDAAGAPKSAAPPASPASSIFGGLFSREKQEAAIAQGVAAGALTAGQALFSADPSPAPAPAQGATAPKASLFTGGSLFPGSGTSKYAGFGDDKPEANPFLSS